MGRQGCCGCPPILHVGPVEGEGRDVLVEDPVDQFGAVLPLADVASHFVDEHRHLLIPLGRRVLYPGSS